MLNRDTSTAKVIPARPRAQGARTAEALPYDPCVALGVAGWARPLDAAVQREATRVLEDGRVLTLPKLAFTLTSQEESFLRPTCLAPGAHCVTFRTSAGKLEGLAAAESDHMTLAALMLRYREATQDLLARLLPAYLPHMLAGDGRFTPVTEKKAQHLRPLHIDAVKAEPSRGYRKLRIVTNIHPRRKATVWRVGEPFTTLVARFLPQMKPPLPLSALFLRCIHATRSIRTPYDHYMLALNTLMKRSDWYQAQSPQALVHFSAASSWMFFSDQVPHAAEIAHPLLEQVYLIPSRSLEDPQTSPLYTLQRLMHRKLV